MSVILLTEPHLRFLSLKGCTGSSESTLVKIPHCWKSHATAHIVFDCIFQGGNDHEIFADPRTIGHSVTSPEDTIKQVKETIYNGL